MQLTNSPTRYGWMAQSLHWIMALIIIALIIMGLYMTELPIGIQKLKFYRWHKEYGILILFLVCFRLIWRWTNRLPPLPTTLPWWQKSAAMGAHYAFYIFMFLMPLSGWMLSSATGLPVSFFGLFVLPDLVQPSEQLRTFFTEVHEWLGYGLILTLLAHMGAAMLHHFIYKDDILKRILP